MPAEWRLRTADAQMVSRVTVGLRKNTSPSVSTCSCGVGVTTATMLSSRQVLRWQRWEPAEMYKDQRILRLWISARPYLLHLEGAERTCCKSDVALSCSGTFGCSERLQGEDTRAKPSQIGPFQPYILILMKRSSSIVHIVQLLLGPCGLDGYYAAPVRSS